LRLSQFLLLQARDRITITDGTTIIITITTITTTTTTDNLIAHAAAGQ
jgi:hypothetical protein